MPRDKLKPRKLPKQERSRETVDAIFEAAIQVLQAKSLKDTPVQNIAERAGVSVGSLYQYFPTKEALVSALIRFYLKQRLAVLERELDQVAGLSAQDAAARLIGSFVDGMSARSAIERAMVEQFCRVGDLFALTQVDEEMNALVERFIRSLGEQVRPVDPPLAAFIISNTLRSTVLLAILQSPERLAQPAFKAELIELVVRYLRA